MQCNSCMMVIFVFKEMRKYIRVMRLDHWVKQLFVLPGVIFALFLTEPEHQLGGITMALVGLLATSLIASANYVINEWLDAQFDKYHPTKKNRSVVTEDVHASVIWGLWVGLTVAGFLLGSLLNMPFLLCLVWLWVMGIVYNVKPLRSKDIPIVDVLSESVNNAIRFLLGWFMVCDHLLPPCSVVLGYWMAGAYLMGVKRFAEYRMIGNAEVAAHYRKSFRFYNEELLLTSSFFYALLSIFFVGVFLVKYRLELVLFIPFLIGLYAYYLWLAFQEDSCVQKPEKLYHEPKLLAYCLFLFALLLFLVFYDFPWLSVFTTNLLIQF